MTGNGRAVTRAVTAISDALLSARNPAGDVSLGSMIAKWSTVAAGRLHTRQQTKTDTWP